MNHLITIYIIYFFLFFSIKNSYSQNIDFKYPKTFKDTTKEEYFGTKVNTPFSWLEDDKSEKTKKWVKSQNNITFSYLNKIPFKNKIKKRLEDIWNYEKVQAPVKIGKYFYFYKNNGLQNQNILYRSKELQGNDIEIFLDPNTFSKDGTTSMKSTSFSYDGSLMAYQISEKGSDQMKVIILDTKTKKQVDDTLKNIKFSNISWKGNEGFYYSSYFNPNNFNTFSNSSKYHKLYFHKIGSSQKNDKLIFDGNKNKIRYIRAYLTEDQRFLVINVRKRISGNKLYIRDLHYSNSKLIPLIQNFDNDVVIIDNQDTRLLIYTNYNAPNYRLIEVDANAISINNWKDVIPERNNVLSISKAGGYLFATYLVDVKSKVIQYDYDGEKIRNIELPAPGTVKGFNAKKDEHFLYYTFTSYTYPSTIFKYNIENGLTEMFWKPNIDFNPENYVTKQVFVNSKDGTKIPMFIVYKKGIKLNGKNPTYLFGYGGFNISLKPSFITQNIVWLENGGIYAEANLRGGGEYGREWHKAGTKMQKQNVFDDFFAVAEFLIEKKYTSNNFLAIAGPSNGGLLIGATITQRPKLAKVALPSVGILDMLKYQNYTGGAGWASEYGTSEESEKMFKYLLNYSPVHSVKDGIDYPATLILTADHDDRVVPAHSFKFAAELQAKAKTNNPILIRIETNAGHGAGGGTPTSKIIQQIADKYAFAWYNMGINPFKN